MLPERLSAACTKWKTSFVITISIGAVVAAGAAFLQVGQLADISNGATLCASAVVAMAVLPIWVRSAC